MVYKWVLFCNTVGIEWVIVINVFNFNSMISRCIRTIFLNGDGLITKYISRYYVFGYFYQSNSLVIHYII